LIENGVYLPENKTNKEYLLNTGDVLVARSGSIGTSLYFDKEKYERCFFAGYLVRFVVNKSNNGRFLYFFTNSKSFYAQIELETIQTTIENFNGQKYANMRIAIPPLPDQTTIANFLDKKTAKIDGIQWIGEIPEGWKVKKLKLVSNRIGDGIHTTPNYVDISDSYFINGNNLVNGRIKITKSTRCVDEIELKKHRQPLNERTLLLSINGTIGNLAFYKGEQIILGKSAAYINLKKKIKVKYVYYFFHCNNIKYYFMKEVTGSTIWNLSLDSVKKTPILYPSSSEQIKIVQYLDKSTSKIDKTIKFIEKKIKLLEEYKKSLVNHVVTGKVDVRKSEI
jgi:type I restriction enzyme S subunit